MDIEERDLVVNLAIQYCRIQQNEDLIPLAEKIRNFVKGTADITKIDAGKYRAMLSAISYCQLQQNEDLIPLAEKIYQFLIKNE
jgi:hypothetical protein